MASNDMRCREWEVGKKFTRSAVPVGKYGSTRVKEPMNILGNW